MIIYKGPIPLKDPTGALARETRREDLEVTGGGTKKYSALGITMPVAQKVVVATDFHYSPHFPIIALANEPRRDEV